RGGGGRGGGGGGWGGGVGGRGGRGRGGAWVMSGKVGMREMARARGSGRSDERVVRMPEGFPLKFAAQFVEKDWPGMGSAYVTAANNPRWADDYDFLSARPKGAKPPLEGYLFPDTYQVDPTAGVNGLIKQQLDQFGAVMTP